MISRKEAERIDNAVGEMLQRYGVWGLLPDDEVLGHRYREAVSNYYTLLEDVTDGS